MKIRMPRFSNFRRNTTALLLLKVPEVRVGIAIVAIYTALAILAPFIAPYDPFATDPTRILQPPSPSHLLGTDEMGRDLLTLNLYAIRPSLIVGVTAALMATVLGLLLGVVAGYFGGLIDEAISRTTDFLIALPQVVLMVIIAALTSPNIATTVLIISLLSWPSIARVIRSATLYIKELPFVEAARALGASSARIVFVHIVPQLVPLTVANMVLSIPNAILSYAALVFLGAGDVSEISWGTILHFAYSSGALIAGKWWYFVPPGANLAIITLGFMLIGQGMQRVLNPRFREEANLG
jgi:peptide/nickel transport system permease protein